ncbi:hypothetical protein P4H70_07285 [Paenibacillus ehimensis]|uniref:hypothetical protein n=1 Tax=Paenibacillus ehimensis TaxID=79264 RepID=UPI002DB8C302|nr:hypothetical protein [Paenibacillus ehimensis]MEC0208751.1 hypothetical protein [Paenibacillus ehimensis]
MSILLRVERESGGRLIELVNGQITGYSYLNTSPADFFAKAYNAVHSLQIWGEIPLRLLPPVEQDTDNSNTLFAWALTEYRPNNDYYRTVIVRIVRHEKTIREVKFTHAYVHKYHEQVNGLKGVLEFELVVRQRRDQLDSIQFGSNENQKNEAGLSTKKQKTLLMHDKEQKSRTEKRLHIASASEVESFKNSWGESYANPFKDRDPNGPMEQIDHHAYRLYTKKDKEELALYYDAFTRAKNASEKQAAHDAANGVRLKYVDSVTRRDFINGGESTIYKTKNGGIGDTKSGIVVEPYVKGQFAISLVGSVGLQAKIQSGELSVSLIKGINGEVGAQLTASAGISINNGGNLEHYVKQGQGKGMGRFYFVEGEVAVDLEDADYEAVLGAGIGIRGGYALIPTLGTAYEHEIKLYVRRLGDSSYPLTYQDWVNHLK